MGRVRGAAAAALIMGVLLSSCGTPPPGRFRRALLVGIVADSAGRPVATAEVEIDGRRAVSTGMDGRFGIPNVRRGRHRIRVRSEGYEPATLELEFADRRQIAYIRLISRGALIDRTVDALAAGRLAQAGELLSRAAALQDPSTDADVLLLEAVLRARQGSPAQALTRLSPLHADPQTRPAAERLAHAIRGGASRTR
jgi:hypothetical protein